MFGGEVAPAAGGFNVACGPQQKLHVSTPQAIAECDSSFGANEFGTPVLAGVAVATHTKQGLTSTAEANGIFVEWISIAG